jgi:hypothetical protein
MMDREESLYFLKKVFPVGVKGEKRVIEVPLEDTVGAIQRAIRDGIDHIVPATDMIGSPWTGLQTSSIKMGNEKMFFPDPNRIGHRKKLFDQSSFVLDCFDGNIGQGFKNGLRGRIFFSPFVEINLFNTKRKHSLLLSPSPPSLTPPYLPLN